MPSGLLSQGFRLEDVCQWILALARDVAEEGKGKRDHLLLTGGSVPHDAVADLRLATICAATVGLLPAVAIGVSRALGAAAACLANGEIGCSQDEGTATGDAASAAEAGLVIVSLVVV